MARDKDGLTEKRRLFIKVKEDNPGIPDYQALIQAGYKPKNKNVARTMANDLMKHPAIQMKLAEHAQLFESVIAGTARDWKDSEKPRQREIALNAAMFGHDKVFGKSTVKIEQQVSVVRIAINLTGDNEEPPAEFIEGQVS